MVHRTTSNENIFQSSILSLLNKIRLELIYWIVCEILMLQDWYTHVKVNERIR